LKANIDRLARGDGAAAGVGERALAGTALLNRIWKIFSLAFD
jgi:hypothetical protein